MKFSRLLLDSLTHRKTDEELSQYVIRNEKVKKYVQENQIEQSYSLVMEMLGNNENLHQNILDKFMFKSLQNHKLEYVIRIFDLFPMRKYNVFCYQNLLEACLKNSMYSEIFRLFKMFSENRQRILKRGSYECLILAYLRVKEFEKAMEVLGTMKKREMMVQESVYREIVEFMVREKLDEKALLFTKELRKEGIAVGEHLYNLLIDGFIKRRLFDYVDEVFDMMTKDGINGKYSFHFQILYAIALHGFEAGYEMFESLKEEEDIRLPVLTYTFFISNLFNKNREEEAVNLFKQMSVKGLRPNVITYNTIINNLLKNRDTKKATEFFLDMTEKLKVVEPNRYYDIIKKLILQKEIHYACDIFDQLMRKKKEEQKIDQKIYCTIIEGLIDADLEEDGMDLFSEMKKLMKANYNTYHTTVIALIRNKHYGKSLDIFLEMKSRHNPNFRTYSEFILQLLNHGYLDRSLSLLNEMIESQEIPTLYTLNTMMFDFILSKRIDMAEHVYQRMKQLDIEPNEFTFNTLRYGYYHLNQRYKLDKLDEEMEDKNVKFDQQKWENLTQSFEKNKKRLD